MLWEVSVLNKIYKTNVFSRVKPRALYGRPIYVISQDFKFSSVMAAIQEDDILTCQSDEEIMKKFKIEIPHESYKKLPGDFF